MIMNSKRKPVMRYQVADYLSVSETDSPEWALMGAGFTSLDEEPGAQTESTKYVNERSASTEVVSYETTFPFEADHIPDEKAVDALYRVGRNHLIGADAQFEYVRVELWDKAEGDNTFKARKFIVSCEVSDNTGDNKMTISGNLNAVGDPVLGTFNTKTLTFTPDEAGADVLRAGAGTPVATAATAASKK